MPGDAATHGSVPPSLLEAILLELKRRRRISRLVSVQEIDIPLNKPNGTVPLGGTAPRGLFSGYRDYP